jgi:hypothetical protein
LRPDDAQIGENLALIRNARLERHHARAARLRAFVRSSATHPTARARRAVRSGTPVHIVSPFENAYAGTEMHAIEIAKLLAPGRGMSRCGRRRRTFRPRSLQRAWFRSAANQGRFPQEGLLVIFGSWQAPPAWLAKSRPARIVVVHNVDDTAPLLDLVIGFARRVRALRSSSSCPPSHSTAGPDCRVRLIRRPSTSARFRAPRRATTDRNGFVVGRLSRTNHHLKFHPDDPDVMRRMIEAGMRVTGDGRDRPAPLLSASRACARPRAPAARQRRTRGRSCARSTLSSTARARCGPEVAGRVVAEAMATGLPCVCARTTWDSRSSSRTASTASCFLPTTTTQRSAHLRAIARRPSTCAMRSAAPRVRAWSTLFGPGFAERVRAGCTSGIAGRVSFPPQ